MWYLVYVGDGQYDLIPSFSYARPYNMYIVMLLNLRYEVLIMVLYTTTREEFTRNPSRLTYCGGMEGKLHREVKDRSLMWLLIHYG